MLENADELRTLATAVMRRLSGEEEGVLDRLAIGSKSHYRKHPTD